MRSKRLWSGIVLFVCMVLFTLPYHVLAHRHHEEAPIPQAKPYVKTGEKSAAFSKHFEDFYLKAIELTGFLRTNISEFPALNRFNYDVEVEIELFKTFLKELEEMELNAEVLDVFTVSMADHMLREEQYFLTKLAQSAKKGRV